MRRPSLLPLLISTLVGSACSDGGRDRPDAGTATATDAGQAAPLGADTLGLACAGACGSADDRLCSQQTDTCKLCLIDPDAFLIAYCTQDCTNVDCPAGWTCQPIKAFGQPQVEKACVAQPAVCGDGAVQLGEVCDGDVPEQGRCVDCMRFDPVCGDGYVQPGEVCDGDVPEQGRCVDCMRFDPVCGDGYVQPGEACDGPQDGQYCIGCASLEAPRIEVMVRDVVANGVERVEGNGTWYYGLGIDAGEYSLTLPTAGDASGCGGVEVLESTSSLTRVAWTLCNDWGISSWQFALPLEPVRYSDFDGEIPAEYGASVLVRARDGSYELTWDMSHVFRFDLNAFASEAPAWSQGNLQFVLEQRDPIQSFSDATAELNIGFRILHPMP